MCSPQRSSCLRQTKDITFEMLWSKTEKIKIDSNQESNPRLLVAWTINAIHVPPSYPLANQQSIPAVLSRSTADEAWYWPKHVLHSGWYCNLSECLFQEEVFYWLFMYCNCMYFTEKCYMPLLYVYEIAVPISRSPLHSWRGLALAKVCSTHWVTLSKIYRSGWLGITSMKVCLFQEDAVHQPWLFMHFSSRHPNMIQLNTTCPLTIQYAVVYSTVVFKNSH